MDITIGQLIKDKGSNVASIAHDASIQQCAVKLQQEGIGSLLILKEGDLIGILYERDIARKAVVHQMDLSITPISTIMSTQFPTVRRDTMVSQAMSVINKERVRHLPVIENDVVYGLVSIGDLNNFMLSSQQEDIDHLVNYITGVTPISFADSSEHHD